MRRIVMVSGPPGAGKTTLAMPLARALGFALITKDIIKEAVHDAMTKQGGGPQDYVASSRLAGGAAMEALWALARHQNAAVIEANFRPRSAYERAKFEALGPHLVEVYCRCPLAECARRFAARATRPDHHPTHWAKELSLAELAAFDQPFGICPVIEADTTTQIDVDALAAQIKAALG